MVSDGGKSPRSGPAGDRKNPNSNRVLIVSASPINRIVISRTVEAIYLRPVAVAPGEAPRALRESEPMIVIVEQEASDDTLKPLLSELGLKRQDGRMPRAVLIASSSTHNESPSYEGLFDAVVPKPLTPDTLQPVVERLSKG